jgi:hypothetical protein
VRHSLAVGMPASSTGKIAGVELGEIIRGGAGVRT